MDAIHEVIKLCLATGLMVAAPIVLTALVIGTTVSLLQTLTSIQEQTLSFVPKLLGCCLCLWLMAPWILEQLGALFEIMLAKAGTFTP
ncbi:MAG: flagellar biosynthetic protein FliQ [Verrucomicrobiota bacterium]